MRAEKNEKWVRLPAVYEYSSPPLKPEELVGRLTMNGAVVFAEAAPAYMTARQAERLAEAEPDNDWRILSGCKTYQRHGPKLWIRVRAFSGETL